LFPQCFGVVQSDTELTYSQWLWLLCQCWVDDGIQVCPQCEALSGGTFCSACGHRLQPEDRRCDECQMPGGGAYCVHCGAALRSATEEAIEAGTFDWDAWHKSLTPFLGGLTPQERALLTRGE